MVWGMVLKVKARYEGSVLKPLEKLDLKEGEEVELEIPHLVIDETYSVSKLSDELIEEILETTERGE
ncbi:MAG: antitoxin family protein [Candidatus Methanospirareceae archaeon]